MGIWERLGNVVKSYLQNDERVQWRSGSGKYGRRESRDPDVDAAFEELDEFLKGENSAGSNSEGKTNKPPRQVPEEVRRYFAELGLAPEASAAECKAAYKKLIKMYHPDRHARNPEQMKKAAEKTAGINAAYEHIEEWFRRLQR